MKGVIELHSITHQLMRESLHYSAGRSLGIPCRNQTEAYIQALCNDKSQTFWKPQFMCQLWIVGFTSLYSCTVSCILSNFLFYLQSRLSQSVLICTFKQILKYFAVCSWNILNLCSKARISMNTILLYRFGKNHHSTNRKKLMIHKPFWGVFFKDLQRVLVYKLYYYKMNLYDQCSYLVFIGRLLAADRRLRFVVLYNAIINRYNYY